MDIRYIEAFWSSEGRQGHTAVNWVIIIDLVDAVKSLIAALQAKDTV